MRAALAACLLLAGCGYGWPVEQYKCFDGTLYSRYPNEGAWRQVDGAPSHSGFTQVPCREVKDESTK